MKKDLGVLGRIFCAFLSVSTVLTSIPQTANAADYYNTEITEEVMESDDYIEVLEPEEEAEADAELMADGKASKYTFKFTGNVTIDPETEPEGIVKVSGKGYYIEADAVGIDVTFNIDPKYQIAYETDSEGEKVYGVSASIGGKSIDYWDLNVEEGNGQVNLTYSFDTDSKNNVILGNFVVNIKTVEKKTFSFSGKCGNTTVMTLINPEGDDEEAAEYSSGFVSVGGKYYYGDEDFIEAHFNITEGYLVDRDSEGRDKVEVSYGTRVLKPEQYKYSNDEDEIIFHLDLSGVTGGKGAALENISLNITFVALKSSYTVTYDTSKMSFDNSEDADWSGVIYENGKIYLCRDANEISMTFKIKKGYFIAKEKDEFLVKVTFNGKETKDFAVDADEETGLMSFSIDIPSDKNDNPIMGNVVITPTFVPYRKVTFSGNFKQIEKIYLDDETSIFEDDEEDAGDDDEPAEGSVKTFSWLEGTEHYFTVTTFDWYEIKSIKYASKELKPDSKGVYRFKVTSSDSKIEITTGTDKSAYTVTGDSKMMTLITSDPDDLEGCIYESGKCYIRKNATGICIPFKVKAGYYVPEIDVVNGCDVKVTIKGSKPKSVYCSFDKYDNTLEVDVDFSLDKNGKPILGDVTITPVFKPYKKVTFSYNAKQVNYLFVLGEGPMNEEDNDNTLWISDDRTIVFEVDPEDGYELKSVTAGSSELKADEDGEYSVTITQSTNIKITTGKFSGPVKDPVEVKVYYNNKLLTTLPENMKFSTGVTYDKNKKKYYTAKATTGTYYDIEILLSLKETDELNKVIYQYGDIKGPGAKGNYYRNPSSGGSWNHFAFYDRKIVRKAVEKGLPISLYFYVNQPKHTLTFSYPEGAHGPWVDFYEYPHGKEGINNKRKINGGEIIVEGTEFMILVDDANLRKYFKEKVTSLICNGKKMTPKNDGKGNYYVIKNAKEDLVIEPVIKPLSDPDEPEVPDDPDDPEEPDDPDKPDEPQEEKDFYEVKLSSDQGIRQVRAVVDGSYLKNQSKEKGIYSYQVPNNSTVTLTAYAKDNYKLTGFQINGKVLKNQKGKVSFKVSADTELSVASEGILRLCYKNRNAGDEELVYGSNTVIKASNVDFYEFYFKKGDEKLEINEPYPSYGEYDAKEKKLLIDCSKLSDKKKTVTVALSCQGLKNPKKVKITVNRPPVKVTLEGFKSNKVKQTAGSNVSYKVKINQGADYNSLAVKHYVNEEKNASVTYDPESKTITVSTFKNSTLAMKPIYFELTDLKGNKIGERYTVEPVAVKFDKLSVRVVDVSTDSYTLAVARPKGSENLINVYYYFDIYDPLREVDDWGFGDAVAVESRIANNGETLIQVGVNRKFMPKGASGVYEVEIYPVQYKDFPAADPKNMTYPVVVSQGEALTIRITDVKASYEKKLKLNQRTKTFFWGEKNITLAAPVFSKNTNCRSLEKVTLEGVSEKDKYSSEDKNSIISIDNEKGLISLTDSERLYPGKYTLTAYPVGEGKAAKVTFTVKKPVTSIEITANDNNLVKAAGKAATGKFKVTCKSTIHGRDYKPTKAGVKYTISSDNEELLKYVSVKNGVITVKKGYCLDYDEAKNRFTVTVSATDRAGKGATASYEFVVTQKCKK